jgi:hypothetical protein
MVPPGGPPPEVTPSSGASSGNTTPTTKRTTPTTGSNSGVTMVEALPLNLTTTRYEENDSRLVWTGNWTFSGDSRSAYRDARSRLRGLFQTH